MTMVRSSVPSSFWLSVVSRLTVISLLMKSASTTLLFAKSLEFTSSTKLLLTNGSTESQEVSVLLVLAQALLSSDNSLTQPLTLNNTRLLLEEALNSHLRVRDSQPYLLWTPPTLPSVHLTTLTITVWLLFWIWPLIQLQEPTTYPRHRLVFSVLDSARLRELLSGSIRISSSTNLFSDLRSTLTSWDLVLLETPTPSLSLFLTVLQALHSPATLILVDTAQVLTHAIPMKARACGSSASKSPSLKTQALTWLFHFPPSPLPQPPPLARAATSSFLGWVQVFQETTRLSLVASSSQTTSESSLTTLLPPQSPRPPRSMLLRTLSLPLFSARLPALTATMSSQHPRHQRPTKVSSSVSAVQSARSLSALSWSLCFSSNRSAITAQFRVRPTMLLL